MKTTNYLLLLTCCMAIVAGCQAQRTTPAAPSVVEPSEPTMPVEPGPTAKKPEDPHVYKPERPDRPELPGEDEHTLVCNAKLDLLRVFVCSDETVQLSDRTYKSDECSQKVKEHFTDMGYRVVEGASPGYNVSGEVLSSIADSRDVDLFVLLKADVKQWHELDGWYSFEADGRGRVAQITGDELITTTSAYVRGKRALSEQQAAQNALQECAKQIGQKLSYEILRKSSSGILLREFIIDGLEKAEQADYIRMGLSRKPGIRSVSLKRWDERSRRAIFLIRLDASVKENLAAYLEQLDNIRLKVEQFERTEVKSREKRLLEF